jgi:hypothetical protein
MSNEEGKRKADSHIEAAPSATAARIMPFTPSANTIFCFTMR